MTVTPNGGTTCRITLAVDPTFLANAVYPVMVDPTLEINSANAVEEITVFTNKQNISLNNDTSYIGSQYELATFIHELGHIFNAPDHYNIGDVPKTDDLNTYIEGYEEEYGIKYYSDSPYDKNCIYGEAKDNYVDLICAGCRKQIMMNVETHLNGG